MRTPGQREKLEGLLRKRLTGQGGTWRSAAGGKGDYGARREIGPLQPEAQFLPSFEQLVWRLAPVISLLALVLIAVFIEIEITSWEDPIQLFVNSAEESMLAHLFGA